METQNYIKQTRWGFFIGILISLFRNSHSFSEKGIFSVSPFIIFSPLRSEKSYGRLFFFFFPNLRNWDENKSEWKMQKQDLKNEDFLRTSNLYSGLLSPHPFSSSCSVSKPPTDLFWPMKYGQTSMKYVTHRETWLPISPFWHWITDTFLYFQYEYCLQHRLECSLKSLLSSKKYNGKKV